MGHPQGPILVQADSVRVVGENATTRTDLRAVRDAAQHLADTVRASLATDLTGVGRLRLPLLPRITLAPAARLDEEPAAPDPRQVAVTVRTVPVRGEAADTHTYRDGAGLQWQTYGQEHDFSTERMLEIQNADGDILATYPPGTWLHVCYGGYLDTAGSQP